jgi:hypothetical protein
VYDRHTSLLVDIRRMNGAQSPPVSPQSLKVSNWAPGTVSRNKGKQKAATICKDCQDPALPEEPGFEQLLSCSSCLESVFYYHRFRLTLIHWRADPSIIIVKATRMNCSRLA